MTEPTPAEGAVERGIKAQRVREAAAGISETMAATRRTLPPPPDAGEVRTYREGVEMACKAFEEAISKGYPTPANKRDQCAHGSFGWQDCIGCYDEALTAAIAAIRKLP